MIQETVSGVLVAQREWLAAVRAKDIDALMRRVTDHIAVIHPNGKTVRGADELRADFERFFGQFDLEQPAQLLKLLASMARSLGQAALGVLLTGMGEDGAEGLNQVRRAGGYTIAEDEST